MRAQGLSRPRAIRGIHWRGLWTHYSFGLLRFTKFGLETLIGPILSSLLFLAVFSIALAETQTLRDGTSFMQYLAPGIAMFTLIHGAFVMAAFPLVYDKLEGSLEDLLMSPLDPAEVAAGYILAGATGGLWVGGCTLLIAWMFVPLEMAVPGWLVLFALLAAVLFAMIGVIVGLWAEKWDQLSLADTFLMLPLAFLSGAFFTLDSVPAFGQTLMLFNPVFHAIDGARQGVLGWGSADPLMSAAVVLALTVVTGLVTWRLFAVGYKIKP